MKDTWFNHNTDKLLLFVLLAFFWASTLGMGYHIFHHDSDNMQAIAFISFMTGSVSTVLGALMLILTGRNARADGQTSNGAPPNSNLPFLSAMQPAPKLPDSVNKDFGTPAGASKQ